jgi:hypothetical protein
MHEIITLEQLHNDFAVKVAHRRQQNAIEESRRPGNNLTPGERDLTISIDGCRAEAAGKLFLNPVKWNAFKRGRLDDTADLEDWIDVKGIMHPDHRLIVQPNGRTNWAYLLIDGSDHPLYRVLCWCWGYEAMQQEYWCDPTHMDRAAFFVPQIAPFMRSPRELFEIVRARQRGGTPNIDPDQTSQHFLHYCHCGKWGAWGYGVDYRNGKDGTWFCMEHKP